MTWPERTIWLDRLLWTCAERRLGDDQITAVINRQMPSRLAQQNIDGFARSIKRLLTGTFALLNEDTMVGSPWQALTWLLVCREREHAPAATWLCGAPAGLLRRHLARLPGFAFLILADARGDTAESMLARDAFWDAMLGIAPQASTGCEDRWP